MEMRKIIVSDPQRCVGCKTCEMVCSFTNNREFNPRKARIRNFTDLQEATCMSLTCLQCYDPPCVKVCPSGALSKEDGVAKIDAAICIGCKLCLISCPFGNIHFDEEHGYAFKCELCEENPQCVAFCPNNALRYEEIESIALQKLTTLFRQLLENKL
jgi:anaerobic carbon-monoxide dehydrogenase iron sulfur subunit